MWSNSQGLEPRIFYGESASYPAIPTYSLRYRPSGVTRNENWLRDTFVDNAPLYTDFAFSMPSILTLALVALLIEHAPVIDSIVIHSIWLKALNQ